MDSGRLRIDEDASTRPDASALPPPPSVRPARHRRLRIAAPLMLIGGTIVLANGMYEGFRMSQLARGGAATFGTLVNSSELDTGMGRTSYQITLDYKAAKANVTYRKDFTVSAAAFDQARLGGGIQVRYLPDDPAVSAAGAQVEIDTEPIVIGGAMIVLAILIWCYLRWQSRQIDKYLQGEV